MPDHPPLDWSHFQPHFSDLQSETLTPRTATEWLGRWSDAENLVWEARAHFKRDSLRDQRDEAARAAYQTFTDEVFGPFRGAVQALTTKFLAIDGFQPSERTLQMHRRLTNQASLFRADNVAIDGEISELTGAYGKLSASIAPMVHGNVVSGPELERWARDADRDVREEAWRATQAPWHAACGEVDRIFLDLLRKRRRQAANAGLSDYRAYCWRQFDCLDYTPSDALGFLDALEAEFVPLASRLFEQRRRRLGIETLRPWDLLVTPEPRPFGQPFADIPAFEDGMRSIFSGVAPEMGGLFQRMRSGFLDLGWRAGKRGGGEEWFFPVTGLPYVHVDQDGSDEGIGLALHECGHAFHDYVIQRPGGWKWDWDYPTEMSEFAAIAMTHLAAPALARDRGGCYDEEEAITVRRRDLDEIVVRWLPLIAQVEAFQHWLYGEAPDSVSPQDLDDAWRDVTKRFTPWVDWSGLERERSLGWRRSFLIVSLPFYNLEYGLAHIGSLQVARNAEQDHPAAWRAYRSALALGGSRPLPALYQAAGARLPFDRSAVREAVAYVASKLEPDVSRASV